MTIRPTSSTRPAAGSWSRTARRRSRSSFRPARPRRRSAAGSGSTRRGRPGVRRAADPGRRPSAGTGSARRRPLELRVAPGAAHEWRLVRVRGDIVDVHRSGDRWTAELLVGGTRVPILGLAGAAIPSAAVVEGRTATIVGDRPAAVPVRDRPAVRDRSSLDARPDDRRTGRRSHPGDRTRAAAERAAARRHRPPRAAAGASANPWTDIDLVAIDEHVGATVRVGGLVAGLEADGFRLDDGTAVARIILRAQRSTSLSDIVADDALSAIGRVDELEQLGEH